MCQINGIDYRTYSVDRIRSFSQKQILLTHIFHELRNTTNLTNVFIALFWRLILQSLVDQTHL